ncbi:MAG TPA: hypothetical protein VEA37_11940, partial [Flavobacterium sp.]|nr:hypothetical protein [Flavobacterium sp.]
MDTRWKSFTHSAAAKIIAFITVIVCLTGVITTIVNVEVLTDGDFGIVFEDNYFLSRAYVRENENVIGDLSRLIGEYKSEKHISDGGTVTEEETRREEENLFFEFHNTRSYNPNLSEDENFKKFREEYADKLTQAKARLIKEDLREYHLLLNRLKDHNDIFYYGSDGVNVYANTANTQKEHFKAYPSFMLFGQYDREFYPAEVRDNEYLHRVTQYIDELDPEKTVIYLAFTEQFLKPRIEEWKEDKIVAETNLYRMAAYLLGLMLSLFYIVLVTGRNSFDDRQVVFSAADRLYNDVKIMLCLGLMILWVALLDQADMGNIRRLIIPL